MQDKLYPIIEISPDVRLRMIEVGDEKPLFALIDEYRYDLKEFLPWVSTTLNCEQTLRFIKDSIEAIQADRQRVYVIEEKGEIAGLISFVSLNFYQCYAEFGYWITPNRESRGLVSSAVRAMINAYKEYIDDFYIVCSPINLRSNLVALRNGFVLLENDSYYDSSNEEEQHYVVTKEEKNCYLFQTKLDS